jgi:hypothetical protein
MKTKRLLNVIGACVIAASSALADNDVSISDASIGSMAQGQRSGSLSASRENALVIWKENERWMGTRISDAGRSLDEGNLVFDVGPYSLWNGETYIVFDPGRKQTLSLAGDLGQVEDFPFLFEEIAGYKVVHDRIAMWGWTPGQQSILCFYDRNLGTIRTLIDNRGWNISSIVESENGIVVLANHEYEPSRMITYAMDGTLLSEKPVVGITWVASAVVGDRGILVAGYTWPGQTGVGTGRRTAALLNSNAQAVFTCDLGPTSTSVSLRWDGTNYFAVMSEVPGGDFYTAEISPYGNIRKAKPVVSGLWYAAGASIVGSNKFVFATDKDGMLGFIVGDAALPPITTFRLGLRAPDQSNPSTVTRDGIVLVTWLEKQVRGGSTDLFARRFLPNGVPIDFEPKRVASGVCEGKTPGVAATPNTFLIAWTAYGATFARRMTRDGKLLDSEPIMVAQESGACDRSIAVAGGTDRFAVVTTASELPIRFVSEAGVVSQPSYINPGYGGADPKTNYQPFAASDGTNFLVTFGLAPARYSLVDRNGVVRHSQGRGAGMNNVMALAWTGQSYSIVGVVPSGPDRRLGINHIGSDGESTDVRPGEFAAPTSLPAVDIQHASCDVSGCAVASRLVENGEEWLLVSRTISSPASIDFETWSKERRDWVSAVATWDGRGALVMVRQSKAPAPWFGSWRLFAHSTTAVGRRRSSAH